jgi:ParB-like chromosome segregation protein Spo0J
LASHGFDTTIPNTDGVYDSMQVNESFSGRATVPIDSLLPANSPRSRGEDDEHIKRLAETGDELPPILVQQGTMRVIDGMHRLRAAILHGHRSIEVEFFDGCDEEAFIRAVERNVAHGLPLTLADRKAAAARILGWRPALSDRSVASVTGLSPKTIGAIRARASEEIPHSNARQGSDGRLRPLDSSAGRLRAAEAIRQNPDASLREVAAYAGISPGTVRKVQARLRAGDDPVQKRRPRRSARAAKQPADGAGCAGRAARSASTATAGGPGLSDPQRIDEMSSILQKLCRDPSLRNSETGRRLLQIIRAKAIDGPEQVALVQEIPPHSRPLLARLARYNACIWEEIESELRRQSPAE